MCRSRLFTPLTNPMRARDWALCLLVFLATALVSSGEWFIKRPATVGGGVVATDDFQSYDDYASLDAQANWVNVSGDQIYVYPSPNKAAGAGVSSAEIRGIRHTATVAADHYASATLGVTGSSASVGAGPAVRMQSGANSFYALVYYRQSSELYLVKFNAGTGATVSGPIAKTYSTGNELKLEADGAGSATRLTGYEDTGSGWVAVFTSVDPGGTYLDGGFAGLCGQAQAGGGDPEVVLTDWESGNN